MSQLVPPPIFVQGQVVKESYSKDQPRFETREQGDPSLSWGLAEGTLWSFWRFWASFSHHLSLCLGSVIFIPWNTIILKVESLDLVCTLKKSVFLLGCVFAGMNINYDLPPEASLLDVSRWPSPDPRSSQTAWAPCATRCASKGWGRLKFWVEWV